jgi:hypothetical protein
VISSSAFMVVPCKQPGGLNALPQWSVRAIAEEKRFSPPSSIDTNTYSSCLDWSYRPKVCSRLSALHSEFKRYVHAALLIRLTFCPSFSKVSHQISHNPSPFHETSEPSHRARMR